MNWYLRLKLYIWWNFSIDRNEFSYKLNAFYIRAKFSNVSFTHTQEITIARRELAHKLDSGIFSMKDIPIRLIKKAKL